MILNCPACATRYTIDDAKLGPAGRTVRCAACKTTWHAEAIAQAIELPLTTPVKQTVEDLQSVKADKVPLKYRAMVEDRKRAKAMTAQTMVWAGLGVAAVLILALAFFLRVDIVKAFPRVAGAYAMAGLRTYGTTLEFGANDAQAKLKGGRFVTTVKAQIKNTSGKPEKVPPVKVVLRDSTLQVFDTQVLPGAGLVVPPHAMRTLVFDVPDPNNMAKYVDIAFDLEAQKAKPKTSHGNAHGKADHDKGEHAAEAGAEGAQAEGHPTPEHGAPEHEATEAAPAHETPVTDTADHGADHGAEHGATAAHAPEIADAKPESTLKLRPSVS